MPYEHSEHNGSICLTPAQAKAIGRLTARRPLAFVELYGSPLQGRTIRLDLHRPKLSTLVYTITPEGVVTSHTGVHLDADEARLADALDTEAQAMRS